MFFNKKNKEEDDELGFDKEIGAPFDDKSSADDIFSESNKTPGLDDFSSNDYSTQSESLSKLHNQGYSQQPQQVQTTNMDSKEFQIMNSKLDAIKSEMDALMQHVLKLEREINSNKKKPMW